MPSDPVALRDAGLRRVSWLTRGAVAGGLALTAAFSAVAAHAFPGRSGRGAAPVPPPAEEPVPPTVDTTEPPSTAPPTSALVPSAAARVRPRLQAPVTAPRPVVKAPPPTLAPVRQVVRPHVVSGGS